MSKVILSLRDPINLINNHLTTQAGVGALDAYMGYDICKQLFDRGVVPPYGRPAVPNLSRVSNNSSVYCRVVNGLCFCRYDMNVTVNLPEFAENLIFSNLPIPTIVPLHVGGEWNPAANKRVLLRVNGDGALYSSGCVAGYYVGSFIYPTI